jgi:hypothetical protein
MKLMRWQNNGSRVKAPCLALQFFPFSARSFAYRAGMSSKAGRSLSTWMSRFDRLNALGLDGNLRRRDVAQKFCAAAEWDHIVIQQQRDSAQHKILPEFDD